MAHLYLKRHLVPLFNLLLHVGHVGENAFPVVDVTNEAEAFVRIEHGHFSVARFVHWLHVLVLGDADLNVFKVHLFPFGGVWWSVHDSAEFVDIGNHVRAVQSALVAFGLLLLELLFLLLLGAFCFTLPLTERFL